MRQTERASSLMMFSALFLISIFLLLSDRSGWLGFIKGGVEKILIPIERKVFKISEVLRLPGQSLHYWRSGEDRIADLERQVAQLTVDAARVEQLKEENEQLRKLLGAKLPEQWQYIPAAMLGFGEQYSIGQGSENGVEPGNAVISENILIGTVSQVSKKMSRMRPLTDPESKIAVYIPESGARGLLVGQFGSQMVLTQILQEESVKEGDIVVTTGELSIPRGLVVGEIEKFISEETDIYKQAVVRPILDIRNLQTVFLVKE